jgi:hypothetical protein
MLTKIVAVAAAGVLLAGCSSDSGSGDPKKSAPAAPAAPASTGAAVDTGDVAVVDPANAIASTTVDAYEGKVDVSVLSLTVRGKLAQLALSITPHTGETLFQSMNKVFGGVPAVSLVDPVNLKRYVVVKDSAGKELGAGNAAVALKGSTTLNYTFAAPPENVASVDVQFGDFPPFRSVPISR